MFCPICGTKNEDGARFCMNCGFAFAEYEAFSRAPESAASGEKTPARPVQEAKPQASPVYTAPRQSAPQPTQGYNAPLQKAPQPVPQYTAPQQPAPQYTGAPAGAPPAYTQPPRGGMPAWAFIAIVAVLALLAGFAVYKITLGRGMKAQKEAAAQQAAAQQEAAQQEAAAAAEAAAEETADASAKAAEIEENGVSEETEALPAEAAEELLPVEEETPEPTPTPEPTAVPVPLFSLLSGDPDLSGMMKVSVGSATATSTIDQSDIGVRNDPILLFDEKDDSNWQEGVDGYGIGERVDIYFNGVWDVRYVGFKLGNWKSDDYYKENAKPKTLWIRVGTEEQMVTFTGDKRIEWVAIENNGTASDMSFTIGDVYPGTKYEDTVISEVYIYGY